MHYGVPIVVFMLALGAMYLILDSGISSSNSGGVYLAIASIMAIIGLSILGIFERSFLRYAILSTLIQTVYFVLDVSTAFIINKSIWFAVVQFINFAIAGGLFIIAIVILYLKVRKEKIGDYAGYYQNNQFLTVVLMISCLALGGMPGFNIFVGEYMIYSTLFTVHPALTMGAIFGGLVCFIFYFRICYSLFAGKDKEVITLGIPTRTVLGILAVLTILLGIIPQILFGILEWFA